MIDPDDTSITMKVALTRWPAPEPACDCPPSWRHLPGCELVHDEEDDDE